jgi:acyl-CoA synthetase (AMP-forming)/AMP-acid ligase II
MAPENPAGVGQPSISAAIAHWARERPRATACLFVRPNLSVEHEISYGELERRTLVAAANLRTVARPGDRVILLLPPGADYLIAFLSCLRAGIVAVPLYPPLPRARQDRITRVIEDCKASCVLTTADSLQLLSGAAGIATSEPGDREFPAPGTRFLLAEKYLSGGGTALADEGPRGEDLAFLQYTSGSTGEPKGVMVDHRNLVQNELAIASGFGVRADDVVVSWLPMYHDMGLIGTTLLPLFAGLKSVLIDTFQFIHDPLCWPRAIAAFGGTCSGGPGFGYALLAGRYDPDRLAGVDLSGWRVAFNGAEPVDHRTMDRFAASYEPHGFRPEAFLPCYGLAEATLFVTGGEPTAGYHAEPFDRDALQAGRLAPAGPGRADATILVSSGRPAAATTVVIRDEAGGPAPAGAIGEICVQGPGVARGYWGNEAATAQTFHARVAGHAGEFLRTGDLGSLQDGRLYVAGRAKDLIIVAGRNYHPQDLETAALATAGDQARPAGAAAFELDGAVTLVLEVRGSAAARLRADQGAIDAVAGAVRRGVTLDCAVDVAELVLVRGGAIPRTSSGKIRRSRTRDLLLAGKLDLVGRSSRARPATGSGMTPDANIHADDIHEVLRQAVAARAGADLSQADESLPLAALGFDSLTLAALKGTVEELLGRTVDSALFFGDLTIEQIAQAATAGQAHRTEELTDKADSDSDQAPMSEGQSQLQFYDRLFPLDVSANLPFALRFGRRIEAGRLQEAVAAVVAAYPSLRTTLGPAGTRVQTVHAETRVPWQVQELEEEDPARIREFFAGVAYQRFDLVASPLIRAAAVIAPTSTTLLLVCHHSVVDYWSLQIAAARIVAGVLDLDYGDLSPVGPSESASAADWARAEARAAASDRGRASLTALVEKWRPLRDQALFPPRPLARRRRNPAAVTDFELGPDVTSAVYEHAKSRGFTPFVSLAAAYLRALHLTTGHDQVVIGVPHHGRNDSRFAGTVGYLVNLVPLLGDFRAGPLGSSPNALDALEERTWRELRESLTHADLPLSHLIRALGPRRDGNTPLFQTTLTFQQSGDGLLNDGFATPWSGCRQLVAEVEIEAFDLAPRDAAFPLGLYGARDGDRLTFRLVRQPDLVDAAFAERVCAAFREGFLRLDS